MTQSSPQSRCLICSLIQEPGTEFCKAHGEIIRDLKEAYSAWQVAYGKISVDNFLSRILNRAETGDIAKQAADFLLKNLGRWS